MENKELRRLLPARKDAADALAPEGLISLLPAAYYGLNRVLDACAPSLSRKVLVVLWAFENATERDDAGKFLTTQDIARRFREWSVVSGSSIASEVSKVKNELFDLNFIKIEGGRDHIHLTNRGEEVARETFDSASKLMNEMLRKVSQEEQRWLKDLALRLLRSDISDS